MRAAAKAGNVITFGQAADMADFGPKPRDYSFKLNRKVKKQALAMAMSARLQEGNLVVIDDFVMDKIKTKDFVGIMNGFDFENCLVITDGLGLPSAHTNAIVQAVRKEYGTFFMGIIIGKAKARGLDGLMDYNVFTDGLRIDGLAEALQLLKRRGKV